MAVAGRMCLECEPSGATWPHPSILHGGVVLGLRAQMRALEAPPNYLRTCVPSALTWFTIGECQAAVRRFGHGPSHRGLPGASRPDRREKRGGFYVEHDWTRDFRAGGGSRGAGGDAG